MNEVALWNLQHDIPEDRRYNYTTYIVESPLDSLVLLKVRNRKFLFDKANYDKFIDNAKKEIAAAAKKEIEYLVKRI